MAALATVTSSDTARTTTNQPPQVYEFTLADAGTRVEGLCVVITSQRLTVIWPIEPECALIYRPGREVPNTLDAVGARLRHCNPYLDPKAWLFGGTLLALFAHLDRLLRLPKGLGIKTLRNNDVIDVQGVRECLAKAATPEAEDEDEDETKADADTGSNSVMMVDLTGDDDDRM